MPHGPSPVRFPGHKFRPGLTTPARRNKSPPNGGIAPPPPPAGPAAGRTLRVYSALRYWSDGSPVHAEAPLPPAHFFLRRHTPAPSGSAEPQIAASDRWFAAT